VKLDATFWRVQAAAWVLYGVIHFLAALPVVEPDGLASMAVIKAIRAATGFGTSLLLALLYRRLFDRSMPVVVTIVILVSAVASQLWFFADRFAMITIVNGIGLVLRWQWFPHGLDLDYGFVLLAWSAAFLVAHHSREAAVRHRQALERELALRDARLKTLNHQLSPHFLFNALNSLRGLIAEDPDRAREMVTRLSRFLSASLGAGHETTLAEELQTAQAYLAIQKVRFESALDAEIAASPQADACRVPAMLLQPLVENAVKHGAGLDGGPLSIRVGTELRDGRLLISVANTGRLVGSGRAAGLGLSNTRARLASFYATRPSVAVRQDGPWVRAEITIDHPERTS